LIKISRATISNREPFNLRFTLAAVFMQIDQEPIVAFHFLMVARGDFLCRRSPSCGFNPTLAKISQLKPRIGIGVKV
jgi:hypothetical protein